MDLHGNVCIISISMLTRLLCIFILQNDKFELLKPGSLQHLGENMLAFLLRAAASSKLPTNNVMEEGQNSDQDNAVYFDILVRFLF